MNEVKIPANIRIRGEHAGFPLSGEHPDFEFTCHRKDVMKAIPASDEAMAAVVGGIINITPIMLLTAQGRGQTFVVCGDAGKEVYAEMGEQLRRFQDG